MKSIPKFIHFNHFMYISYPFGVNWEHEYIQNSAKIIYDTYKNSIKKGIEIALVARGSSGAMIAGAILNELHHNNSSINAHILIVRKDDDTAHCYTLSGIGKLLKAKFIIVDDFIGSGKTVHAILKDLDDYFSAYYKTKKKYDMLCISNVIEPSVLNINKNVECKKWKKICSRFKYIVCSPKLELHKTSS